MKRENIFLLIGALIMISLATLLILLQTAFVVSTPLEKLFNQKITLSTAERPSDRPNTILSRQKVFDKNGEEIAVLYVAGESNPFGIIELYVAIIDDKVYVIDKILDQTEQLDFTRQYLLDNYQGLTYLNVEYVDGAAGATTVSYSRNTIKSIVQSVADYHFGPKNPPIEPETPDYISEILELDADNYTKETTGTTIIKHEILINSSNEKRIIYEYKKSVSYNAGTQTSGDITLFILLDETGTVENVLLPEALYNHSINGSGYGYAVSKAYLEVLIGKQITESLTIPAGASTGNTVSGIKIMIDEIVEVYHNED